MNVFLEMKTMNLQESNIDSEREEQPSKATDNQSDAKPQTETDNGKATPPRPTSTPQDNDDEIEEEADPNGRIKW